MSMIPEEKLQDMIKKLKVKLQSGKKIFAKYICPEYTNHVLNI